MLNNNSKIEVAIESVVNFFESYAKVLERNHDEGFLHFMKTFYHYPVYYAYTKATKANVVNTKKATFGLFDKTVELDIADMYQAEQIKNQIKNIFKA